MQDSRDSYDKISDFAKRLAKQYEEMRKASEPIAKELAKQYEEMRKESEVMTKRLAKQYEEMRKAIPALRFDQMQERIKELNILRGNFEKAQEEANKAFEPARRAMQECQRFLAPQRRVIKEHQRMVQHLGDFLRTLGLK